MPSLLRTAPTLEESGLDFQFADGMAYPNFIIENLEAENLAIANLAANGENAAGRQLVASLSSPRLVEGIELQEVGPSANSDPADPPTGEPEDAAEASAASGDADVPQPSQALTPRHKVVQYLTMDHTLAQVGCSETVF